MRVLTKWHILLNWLLCAWQHVNPHILASKNDKNSNYGPSLNNEFIKCGISDFQLCLNLTILMLGFSTLLNPKLYNHIINIKHDWFFSWFCCRKWNPTLDSWRIFCTSFRDRALSPHQVLWNISQFLSIKSKCEAGEIKKSTMELPGVNKSKHPS